MNMEKKLIGATAGLVIAAILPLFVPSGYVMHVLIVSLMYAGLVLTYDIAAGHVGSISLAHPVFFGLGAYIAAILAREFNVAFWANMLIAMAASCLLAFLLAIPAFRLRDLSFAVATLGLALSAQIVALNWIDVTGGPGCLRAVPRPFIAVGGERIVNLSSPVAYYYLFLGMALIIGVIYELITSWRLGRRFTAIRNDELLASSIGINVIHYKRIAFVVGAVMAGAVGSLWAHYITVVCPDNLGIAITNNLLIFIFVGGAGHLGGIVAAAVLFTIIPELLRITPTVRLILFGIILFATVVLFPNGLAGAFNALRRRLASQTGG